MRFHDLIGKAITVFVLLAFILTSCSSYKSIHRQAEPLRTELKAGDFVRIATNDGRHIQFKIVAIRADSLFGEKQQIAFDEIAKIERKKRDTVKTVIAVVLEGTVLFFVIGLIALASDPITITPL